MNNRAEITVEFDSAAWSGMTPDDRQAWLDEVIDAICDLAYVAGVRVK